MNPRSKPTNLSTQRYLSVAEIHDDTVGLKNGGVRAVLEVEAVNFALKSEEEQNAIIYGYQSFLNSLEFPVQILVRSRKLDLDGYLKKLKEQQKHLSNPLLQEQLSSHIDYLSRLVECTDIMSKKFYVIVSYDPLRADTKGSFWRIFRQKLAPSDTLIDVMRRRREFDNLHHQLKTRLNMIQTGLTNCGLVAKRLNTSQLIELFYQSYNDPLSQQQKLADYQAMAIEGNESDALIPSEDQ